MPDSMPLVHVFHVFNIHMITRELLEPIGVLGKPHGVQGECSARLTVDLSTLYEEEERLFLFFELDALFVPFRLIGYREKNDNVTLLRFANIDSKEDAEKYVGISLFLERQYVEDESMEYTWEHFIDFTVCDSNAHVIGTIKNIDDSTLNTLCAIVTPEGKDLLLPIAEDLILDMDIPNRKLTLVIPEGLLQL